ncbi:MAG TPA: histidinol-phosphatase [Cyclobacteriaceae bacterium]|nr:histidinol-phosphatase [Cyclobacteriaceae bacterium]
MESFGWTNYHCHSTFCDGKHSLAEMVHHGETLGMRSMGISSHAPLPFDCAWCMPIQDLDGYISQINQLKQSSRLELYLGLEIDFIPGIRTISDFSHRLDYTIGSVHFASLTARPGFEVDGAASVFRDGLQQHFQGDIKSLVKRYFELTRMMIQKDPPSIVGHLDKIKMQNKDHLYFDETEGWYQKEVENTLQCISTSPCLLEVNTRGMYKKKTMHTYPSPWILKRAFEMGIPVTLSSDAHTSEEMTCGFSEAAVALIMAGYQEIHILSNGTWKPARFNESGIL